MSKAGAEAIHTQLADWRARGADRLAPLRFYFIEALARRTANQSGDARRLLDERLCRQVQAYQDEVVEPAGRPRPQADDARHENPGNTAAGPLAEVAAYAARQALGGGIDQPEVIEYFRNAWARASANGLLRQSRSKVPGNAGPLNSSSLTHRALVLMREVSPGYLHHFLSYMEALSWMEQLHDTTAGAGSKPAPPGKRKTAKRKA